MNLLGSTFFLRVTSVQWVVEQRIFFLGFLCCERGTEHGEFCDLLVLLSTSTAWD